MRTPDQDPMLSTAAVIDQPAVETHRRSRRPIWALLGATAAAVVAPLIPSTASAHAQKVVHARSTLGTQAILDEIHHVAFPGEAWKSSQKAWVKPYAAFIKPGAVEFKTDCGVHPGSSQWGNTYSFYKFELSASKGLQDKSCGIGDHGSFTDPSSNQYVSKLEKFGNQIQAAVGLNTEEAATSISGTTSSVTASFTAGTQGDIENITIYKNKIAAIFEAA